MSLWRKLKFSLAHRTRRVITLIGLLQFFWYYKLTRLGKALVITGLVSAAMASGSLLIPVYYLFVALFCLGGTAFLWGLVHRPRFGMSGRFPAQVTAGETMEGHFTLTNTGRLPAYDISAGMFFFPPGMEGPPPHLAAHVLKPKHAIRIPLSLSVSRRGIFHLPLIRAFTTFPFGICRAGSTVHRPGNVTVLPRFHPITTLNIPISRRYQPGGLVLTSQVGDSTEYIGNRNYTAGDPQRKVDFRAWARLGTPIVKEFQEEYFCRIALILDTHVPPVVPPLHRRALTGLLHQMKFSETNGTPPYNAQLEAAVSLSATLADIITREEYIIDVFAAGPELFSFRSGRHTNHFNHVMEILASVDACPDNPFGIITPALTDELNQLSAIVCILLDWDESRHQLMQTAAEAGCSTRIVIVRDGPTTCPVTGPHEPVSEITFLTPDQVLQGGIDRL